MNVLLNRIVVTLGLFLTVATLVPIAAADSISPPSSASSAPAAGIIVQMKDSIDINSRAGAQASAALAASADTSIGSVLPDQNIIILTPENGISTSSILTKLNADPSVAYAEPNYVRSIATLPSNDPYNSLLWAFDNVGQTVAATTGIANADINLPEAWNISEGSADTIVAVIDTGVLYTHPDLANRMWDGTNCVDENGLALGGCQYGYDFSDNDTSPLPDITSSVGFHGTHVSGIIGAENNNGIGVAGVAPHARIMALRFALDVASEVRAIDFARNNGAKIINASYTGPEFSQAEHDAIERFQNAGGLFVAAAGNNATSNNTAPVYPASYDLPGIISVAATDGTDALATYSNYGSIVSLAAPGSIILSTYLNNAYAFASGTSMASPMVAGTAALLWSYDPSLTATQIKQLLTSEGDVLPALSGKTSTGTRLDAYRALAALSPVAGLESDNAIPSYAVSAHPDNTTFDISFKVRAGISGLPVTLIDAAYKSGTTWISLSTTSAPALSTITSFSGATSTLSLTLPVAATTSPVFRLRFSDGATSTPYLYTGTSTLSIAPTALLSELPNATDTSAVPVLNAVVGGTGTTEYSFSLDGATWSSFTPVATRIASSSLLNGSHTLSVVARDAGGLTQATTSSTQYTWIIRDLTAPAISGLSDDAIATNSKYLSWNSDDPQAVYRFAASNATTTDLSALSYTAATSTTVTSGNGTQYFFIQSRDINGNESSVSRVSFLMDTLAPTAQLSGPDAVSISASTAFTVSGDGVVLYKYLLDGSGWSTAQSVSSLISLSNLANGSHSLSVIGADAAGNWQSIASSTVFAWTVQVPAPAPVSSGGGGGGGGYSAPASSSGYSAPAPVILPAPVIAVPAPAQLVIPVINASSTATAESNNPARLPTASVLGAQTYLFRSNLQLGSRGKDVTALQQALTRLGFFKASTSTYFGPVTRTAVKAYQKAHKISQTGTIGPLTRSSLNTGF